MAKQNSGLGTGLASLIPGKKTNFDNNVQQAGKSAESGILEIDINKIVPNPHQPRISFDQAALEDLAQSIKRQGILQPLVVTKKGELYELVAGERRLRASKIAGLKNIPAILKDFSDQRKMEAAFVENAQRENLNSIEEAKTYQKLKDNFDLTIEEIAESVGKSRETVSNGLRILNLPAEVQRMVLLGEISKTQALVLLKLENINEQILFAKKMVEKQLSAKEAEEIIDKNKGAAGKNVLPKQISPQIVSLERELAEKFKTKVKISGALNKGKIMIEYFSEEEFNNILKNLWLLV
ncbi:MAG: ParB/RepB/Spo0J family partition protein [bacterium]